MVNEKRKQKDFWKSTSTRHWKKRFSFTFLSFSHRLVKLPQKTLHLIAYISASPSEQAFICYLTRESTDLREPSRKHFQFIFKMNHELFAPTIHRVFGFFTKPPQVYTNAPEVSAWKSQILKWIWNLKHHIYLFLVLSVSIPCTIFCAV